MTWTDKFKRYNEFNYFVEFEFFTKLKDDSIVESFKKNLGGLEQCRIYSPDKNCGHQDWQSSAFQEQGRL